METCVTFIYDAFMKIDNRVKTNVYVGPKL